MTIESNDSETLAPRSTTVRNIGIALILLSGVFFFTMLAVPLFSIGAGQKAILAGGLFVGVQVSWWVGAAMVGPAAVNKIRSWFGSKKNNSLDQ